MSMKEGEDWWLPYRSNVRLAFGNIVRCRAVQWLVILSRYRLKSSRQWFKQIRNSEEVSVPIQETGHDAIFAFTEICQWECVPQNSHGQNNCGLRLEVHLSQTPRQIQALKPINASKLLIKFTERFKCLPDKGMSAWRLSQTGILGLWS